MGALRERATAELRAREEDEAERKRREEQTRARQHEDRAKPAAEFLSKWSGEEVRPRQLQEANGSSPGFNGCFLWSVRVDDFDLLVKQKKIDRPREHGPKWQFQIHQCQDNKEPRQVDKPADLLAPWLDPHPVEDEVHPPVGSRDGT